MLHNLYEVNLIWDAANKVDEKLQSLTKLQQLCNVVFYNQINERSSCNLKFCLLVEGGSSINIEYRYIELLRVLMLHLLYQYCALSCYMIGACSINYIVLNDIENIRLVYFSFDL